MGQSTNAILFYGYCWDDEGYSLLDESEDEWDEIVARREGHTSPWDLYRDSGAEAEHESLPYAERDAAYKAWKQTVRFDSLYKIWTSTRDDIKARFGGVNISSHCSCDYPMPYIYIERSKTTASRGFPKQIDPSGFSGVPTATWNMKLKKFTDDLNIDLSEAEGPGWFLVSNWC